MAQAEAPRPFLKDRFSCLPHPRPFSPETIFESMKTKLIPDIRRRAEEVMFTTLERGELSREDILRMNNAMIRIMGGSLPVLRGEETPARELLTEVNRRDVEVTAQIRFGGKRVDDVPGSLLSVLLSSKAMPGSAVGAFNGAERIFLPEGSQNLHIASVGTIGPHESEKYYSYIKGNLQERGPRVTLFGNSSEELVSQSRMVEPEELRSFFTRSFDASQKPPMRIHPRIQLHGMS